VVDSPEGVIDSVVDPVVDSVVARVVESAVDPVVDSVLGPVVGSVVPLPGMVVSGVGLVAWAYWTLMLMDWTDGAAHTNPRPASVPRRNASRLVSPSLAVAGGSPSLSGCLTYPGVNHPPGDIQWTP